jgi:N-acetyl-anhydromuramyl-L-alanine amidase AmpD
MYPFIQAAKHGPDANLPVTRIVIHGTVSPCRAGQARATAAYFQTVKRSASAHYVVDPGEVVQCVSEATIAYHAPPNAHSIGVELCDPQTGDAARWDDANHEAMLVRAAGLVRALAAKHNIPIVKLGPAQLLAGAHGICGHVDVTNAWHQTTHVDPGPDFPWAHFLTLVRSGTTTTTSQAGSGLPNVQEDDMTPEESQRLGRIYQLVERYLDAPIGEVPAKAATATAAAVEAGVIGQRVTRYVDAPISGVDEATARFLTKPEDLAAELVKHLPAAGQSLTAADVEAALRAVFADAGKVA